MDRRYDEAFAMKTPPAVVCMPVKDRLCSAILVFVAAAGMVTAAVIDIGTTEVIAARDEVCQYARCASAKILQILATVAWTDRPERTTAAPGTAGTVLIAAITHKKPSRRNM